MSSYFQPLYRFTEALRTLSGMTGEFSARLHHQLKSMGFFVPLF